MTSAFEQRLRARHTPKKNSEERPQFKFLDGNGNTRTEKDLGGCGKEAWIAPTAVIHQPENLYLDDYAMIDHYCVVKCALLMGRHAKIGAQCVLMYGKGKIIMGDFAECGPGCFLVTGSNNYRGDDGLMAKGVPEEYSGTAKTGTIEIHDHAIFGVNNVILEGTTVPEGVMLGCNSMLSEKSALQPWTLYAGTPAKEVGPVDGTKVKEAKKSLFRERYNE